MERDAMHVLIENARNVVFDVGCVLLNFEPEKYIPLILEGELASRLKPSMLFETPMWDRLDEGTVSEEEVARDAAGRYGDPAVWPQILRVIQGFHAYMEPLPPAQLIPRLHAMGKRVYALSNYGLMSFARTEKRFADIFSQMDGMVISGREKVMKPDERIYRLLLERYHLVPEECVFIDDRPGNIAAAQKIGMKGIVYTGEDALR